MNDDLYPNDSSYFTFGAEPEEQKVERKKERAKTLEALSLAKELVAHFEERIADRDNLNSIQVDIAKDPELFQKVYEVNKLLKQALIEEKLMLEDKIEVHAKNR